MRMSRTAQVAVAVVGLASMGAMYAVEGVGRLLAAVVFLGAALTLWATAARRRNAVEGAVPATDKDIDLVVVGPHLDDVRSVLITYTTLDRAAADALLAQVPTRLGLALRPGVASEVVNAVRAAGATAGVVEAVPA